MRPRWLPSIAYSFFVEGGRERTWLLQYRPHVRRISQVGVPNVREELVVRMYVSGHLGKESCKACGVYAVHTWVERGGCVTAARGVVVTVGMAIVAVQDSRQEATATWYGPRAAAH